MKPAPDLKAQLHDAERILVSYSDKLGDCIHTLPALRVLRAHAPRARIFFLASNLACPLLDRCVDIDETIPMGVDYGSSRQTKWRARLRLLRRLFRAGFDLHVDFFPGVDQILFTTLMAGVQSRLALNNSRNTARKRWFYDYFPEAKWQNQLSSDFALDQLSKLGLDARAPALGPAYLRQPVSPRSEVPRPYIHVAPFASECSRELVPAVLIDTLRRFAATYPDHHIALSAAPVLRELAGLATLTDILQAELGARLRLYPGTLDTAGLADLIAGAEVHVGCDSGTLHTAILVGARTITWFLNHESVLAWAPRDRGHSVLISAAEQSRNGSHIKGISADLLMSHLHRRLESPVAALTTQGADWVYSLTGFDSAGLMRGHALCAE